MEPKLIYVEQSPIYSQISRGTDQWSVDDGSAKFPP
jgi:hypothetical protein